MTVETTPVKMSESDYVKLAMEKSDSNHIWLNKMVYYISPTDADKIKLADMILEKLKTKSTQIPAEGITSESELMREMAELTPILYLRVNWS